MTRSKVVLSTECNVSKCTSLIFKRLQAVRFCDPKRNALVCLSYSDSGDGGFTQNALSAVPIMLFGESRP
ncbi:CreA family protein [Sodalis sp.]|uniref:CreA family protein n=1 Tax=Sodalis sp. (in: enterobacteria) TaxID=1898979 RepID=UPI0038735E55